jgi:hypothetical protein
VAHTNLAPVKTYKNNNITMQNDTYTRMKMTHQFRYDQLDFFLLPNNFEEVFQRMNFSIDAIKKNWTDIEEKHQHLKNWKFFSTDRQLLSAQFNATQNAINQSLPSIGSYTYDFKLLHRIDDQISEYIAENMLLTFKNVIARKLKDIAVEVFTTMLAEHVANFFKTLQK